MRTDQRVVGLAQCVLDDLLVEDQGHPFCVTIDTEARDYLPHLYGAVNWALVEDVKKLPLKVLDIYRRLTT